MVEEAPLGKWLKHQGLKDRGSPELEWIGGSGSAVPGQSHAGQENIWRPYGEWSQKPGEERDGDEIPRLLQPRRLRAERSGRERRRREYLP